MASPDQRSAEQLQHFQHFGFAKVVRRVLLRKELSRTREDMADREILYA